METLFTRKESIRHPGLFVEKYKRKVFYDGLWNDELVEMRGRVVDANGKVVINPFTKIFNRFERDTNIPLSTMVVGIEKVNGFMAAATFVPSIGEVVVSTTGSLDSDFVALAEKHLQSAIPYIIRRAIQSPEVNRTWLFEIVDESDPHIIKEKEGAYLLASRVVDSTKPYSSSPAHEQLLDFCANNMGVMRPKWEYCSFRKIVNDAKECHHEGFVAYDNFDGVALKIKSPYYLVTKFFARIGTERLLKGLKDVKQFRSTIDEEYYDLVDEIAEHKEHFVLLDEQRRILWIENVLKGKI